jgi:predicted phosphodiesterase
MATKGYCKCGRRTQHKNAEGNWFCIICEMSLEKKITGEQQKILELVGKSNITPRELQIILNAPRQTNISHRTYDHSIYHKGKFGVISDTHIGEKHFDEGLFKFAGETFKKNGVEVVYHVGDILEGMSGRPGHIYELAQIGFSQQINYATSLFKKHFKDFKLFGITGNHDQWYKNKNNGGVDVGEEVQARIPNFQYLGENEADIHLGEGIYLKLFHANDGTAYADSYKMQKLVESLEGGKKPHILIEGHYHKSMYMFRRNIHCIEAGTICGQTDFLRGKKIPVHKGFWIVEYEVGKRDGKPSIVNFNPRFFPAYD